MSYSMDHHRHQVLVTGASGFLASWIVKYLIEQHFEVIGVVKSDTEGISIAEHHDNQFKYIVIEDTSLLGSFDKLFSQKYPYIKYVIHIPVLQNSEVDYNAYRSLIIPAIKETHSLLNSINNYGTQVKKLIVTTSIVAILKPSPFTFNISKTHYNEDSWNMITGYDINTSPYLSRVASMTYAEKEVWKFMDENNPSFAISTIMIPLVFGPPINDMKIDNLNPSNQLIYDILKWPKYKLDIENFPIFFIDVRDAAIAHVKSMINEQLDNKRCLVIAGISDTQHLLDTIRRKNAKYNSRLPLGKPNSSQFLRYASYNNAKTQMYLQMIYFSLDKTLSDTIDAIEMLEMQRNKQLSYKTSKILRMIFSRTNLNQ